jgi:hypothetical protein
MFGRKKIDTLNMEYDSNRTWLDDNPDTMADNVYGVIWTVGRKLDKIMSPFFEFLSAGLAVISFLIWIAIIAFVGLFVLLLIIGIVTGLLGIDLTPAAEIAAAMK